MKLPNLAQQPEKEFTQGACCRGVGVRSCSRPHFVTPTLMMERCRPLGVSPRGRHRSISLQLCLRSLKIQRNASHLKISSVRSIPLSPYFILLLAYDDANPLLFLINHPFKFKGRAPDICDNWHAIQGNFSLNINQQLITAATKQQRKRTQHTASSFTEQLLLYCSLFTLKDTALSLPSFQNNLNPLTPTLAIWAQL